LASAARAAATRSASRSSRRTRSIRPIQSIAEIPFHERSPLEALNLVVERDRVELDDIGFGWCRVGSLWLASRAGAEPRHVEDALVLALHASEEQPAPDSDVELEFWIEEIDPDYVVNVPLARFLDVWLPRLVDGSERSIVLALCNPGSTAIARPAAAGRAELHFGLGDVDSWREDDEISLLADTWRTV
jgi:hypothetical protein